MAVYYYQYHDRLWLTECSAYVLRFLHYFSNESIMFVPGTYDEMMEDYG